MGWGTSSARLLAAWAFLLWFAPSLAAASGQVFGIVGKSRSDRNFVAVYEHCNAEAARSGDRCELLAPVGASNPRLQARVLKEALASRRYAGLAVSVTDSNLLRASIREADIPVITFDSPYVPAEGEPALPYIGCDNEELGRSLARLARRLRPAGGTLCVMTDPRDVNLERRLLGLRRELSRNDDFLPNSRLAGEAGWKELDRCPLDVRDDIARATELTHSAVAMLKPDVIVSVGHWTVLHADEYRAAIAEHRDEVRQQRPLMLSAFGAMTDDIRALVRERLLHGVVAVDFPAMGQQIARHLQALGSGRTVPPSVIIPSQVVWRPKAGNGQIALGVEGASAEDAWPTAAPTPPPPGRAAPRQEP